MNDVFLELTDLLKSKDFDNVLILCHSKPDGDTLGSAFALWRALCLLGKRARVDFEKRDDDTFDYITNVELEDFEHKRIVTVDVADLKLVDEKYREMRIDAVIDHHLNNRVESDIKLCLSDRASCAEIVFELIEGLGVEMDEYIAKCLYTGMATDTGRFCYPNTTARTFEYCARLSGLVRDGNFAYINKLVFETFELSKLRLEAAALDKCEFYFEGRLALLSYSLDEYNSLGCSESDFEGLVNVLRKIKGVEVSVFIKPWKGLYKASLRAEPGYDCAAVCQLFGGGGHKLAAGCSLDGDICDVKKRILDALCEVCFNERSTDIK